MKTTIKTVVGLCSMFLFAPALVQAQEAKLFYAQGHSNTGSHHRVIVVNNDRHDQHRDRGHNRHGNGHGYGHVSDHHEGHHHRRHNRHHNRHHYQHHNRHHYQHHDTHYYGHGGGHGTHHSYQSGPDIERVYVNPQLFR